MRRYLCILDDVWNPGAYLDLKSALHDNNHGSRIVITTRLNEVASVADQEHCMVLRKLYQSEAWE